MVRGQGLGSRSGVKFFGRVKLLGSRSGSLWSRSERSRSGSRSGIKIVGSRSGVKFRGQCQEEGSRSGGGGSRTGELGSVGRWGLVGGGWSFKNS